MKKIEIYDPPMCCSTGVCGPTPDPELMRISADIKHLSERGADIARYNMAFDLGAFASNPAVLEIMTSEGNEAFPVITSDGAVAAKGKYPSREELAVIAGIF